MNGVVHFCFCASRPRGYAWRMYSLAAKRLRRAGDVGGKWIYGYMINWSFLVLSHEYFGVGGRSFWAMPSLFFQHICFFIWFSSCNSWIRLPQLPPFLQCVTIVRTWSALVGRPSLQWDATGLGDCHFSESQGGSRLNHGQAMLLILLCQIRNN